METGALDHPRSLTDYLNLLSAAWLWRLTVVMSLLVWGSVFWALFALFLKPR